jgi:2-dehydro-3-deoxyphosphogluconate aldolase/(4S)-4-hydroxy-2-oxoglutarate aldolase
VEIAGKNHLPIFPGIATSTELQRAWNMGLRTVKFFPASLLGGPRMIESLCSVFRDMSFVPTGGVSAKNLADYLAIPAVIACGGSWLTPRSVIDERNFDAVTLLATEAVAIASAARA